MQGAIDRNGLPGQVIAAIAHQEHGQIGQLVHLAIAAHRNAAAAFAPIGRLRGEAFPRALGGEGARRNRIQADAMRPPFGGERFGHHVQARFRHGGGYGERPAVPHPGGEDGDHAALVAAFDPAFSASQRDIEAAAEDDIGDRVEAAR